MAISWYVRPETGPAAPLSRPADRARGWYSSSRYGPLVYRATMDSLRYTLSFPAPETHYVEVAMSVPTSGRPFVELMMAVWTPGSYLVREYERHVEGITAEAAGRELAVEKVAK